MRLLIATLLALLLWGAAGAEPEPESREDTPPLLQGDPDGQVRPAEPMTRNELIELLDRSDRTLSDQQAELAPASELDELHRLIQETGRDTEQLEERVEELEEDQDQLDQREQNTARPGF